MDAAVAETLGYLERHACATRRGHQGHTSVAGDGFVTAGFRHQTNRNGDPMLHTHVLIANVVKADGRWGTLDALDTVRQSLRSVQDLAKSATERVLASLVAVGAVVAANSTKTLSNEVGRNLLLLVALFLLLLALYALFVEGPLLDLPLRHLDADLREGNAILTEAQRQRAMGIPSVTAVKRRVCFLRIVIPTTYLVLTLAIVVLGHPEWYS